MTRRRRAREGAHVPALLPLSHRSPRAPPSLPPSGRVYLRSKAASWLSRYGSKPVSAAEST